jgi:hypothetical protein
VLDARPEPGREQPACEGDAQKRRSELARAERAVVKVEHGRKVDVYPGTP